MTHRTVATTRGLSLLELLLAMAITALVAAAIAAMLGAVTSGLGTRRDSRALMVRANAAQTRLAGYITPCRSFLAADGSGVVLWLDDARESDSVHASEIRWLVYDSGAGTLDVLFVDFPAGGSEVERLMADQAYPPTADWNAARAEYDGNGWLTRVTLIDSIDSFSASTDQPTALDSRHVTFDLDFQVDGTTAAVRLFETIRLHQPPL
ncbi:MAG: hypothetical protein ACYSXF_01680 [Planctomycetota bacterium]|jgi:type II secretory pathway pseudopilin PulG